MRNHRTIRALLIAVSLVVIVASGAWADDPPAKPSPDAAAPAEPKEKPAPTDADIRNVTRDLAAEAARELKGVGAFPRKESDYAQVTNTRLPSQAVVDALGRRLDRNPAVDAYVKWQLLSYQPVYSEAGEKGYESIVRGLPSLLPRPAIKSNAKRAFDLAAQGPQPKLVEQLKKAIDEYELLVQQVNTTNGPAVAYRDKVIMELPETDGMRLVTRFQDVQHRYRAGDHSYTDALNRLISEARFNMRNEVIPARVRAALIKDVEKFAESDNGMIDKIVLKADGKVNIEMFGKPMRGKQRDDLIAYLKGEEPKP